MTLEISEPGEVVQNDETIEGDPAILISADNVHFINAGGGRLYSLPGAAAVISIEGSGGLVENRFGAVIHAGEGGQAAIVGSAGSDRLLNFGVITGHIFLGDGNDEFIQTQGSGWFQNMGAGDDIFQFGVATSSDEALRSLQFVDGGEGYDTLVLEGDFTQIVARDQTGFEKLVVGQNIRNLTGFSGFQEIVLSPLSDYQVYTFLDSNNPTIDIVMQGGGLSVSTGSVFRSFEGSDDKEIFHITNSGVMTGDVHLKGGDDFLEYSSWSGNGLPTIGGVIDGGEGTDQLVLTVVDENTVNMSNIIGFEILDVGRYYYTSAILTNVSGFTDIYLADGSSLTLVDSNLSAATIRMDYPSTVVLDNSSVLRIGLFEMPFVDPATIEQPDVTRSSTVINRGEVVLDVKFHAGDDYYDGSSGTVGGTIYGYAGNDTLIGGVEEDRFIGGFGADTIDGRGGFDVATYENLFRSYRFAAEEGAVSLASDTEGGTDTLSSTESLEFFDGDMTFDPDSLAAQITRLYDTVLQRGADAPGLDYWMDEIEDRGSTIEFAAASLLGSQEFQATAGHLSDADFVSYLYQHALGRSGDTAGEAYWVERLSEGMNRADVLLGFSESGEHRILTEDLIAQGLFETDDAYQSIALLYDSFAGRAPDSAGLIYWAGMVQSGAMTLAEVAENFALSPEFRNMTALMSHDDLVGFMYQNSLGRPADYEGREYWSDMLDNGMSEGELLLGFSQSFEHYNLMAPAIVSGIEFV